MKIDRLLFYNHEIVALIALFVPRIPRHHSLMTLVFLECLTPNS